VTGDPTLWILARSTGVVAYALLTSTVLAGLTAKSRPVRSLNPAATVDLHRFLSLLSLMAVALHGAFLALDTSVPIPVVALLVPGTSPYRPLWVALGVLGAELMLLIHLSFRFRRRIGVRTWRRLHYATYLVFGAATAHGLMAGSDSARPWALAMYVLATGAVVALTAWRVLGAPRRAPAPAAAQPAEPAPVAAVAAGAAPATSALIEARSEGRFTARAAVTAPAGFRYRATKPPSRSSTTASAPGVPWPIIWSRHPNWSDQKDGEGEAEGA
jgi:sulfoxide reductase heme-binding subunit YedZ